MKAVFMPARRDDSLLQIVADYPELDFSVVYTADELAEKIVEADILVINNGPYSPAVAEVVCTKGRKLRWVQFSTAGAERAIRNGLPEDIPVTCASGIKASTVAEHAMTMLLALVRRLRDVERARTRQAWDRDPLFGTIGTLEAGCLLIVGYGSIGQEVARKAKAFDMRVAVVTREGRPGPTVDAVFPRSEINAALSQADAVVLCLPSAPETRGFIGPAEFAAMKPSAYLVNVARGDLIDETAFLDALRSNKIRGAAIDVTEIEPLPPSHPFWTLDNLLITPHVAGAGGSGYGRFAKLFSENLRRLQDGEPLLQRLHRTTPIPS
jgi:phosphoglycerate dehydrogenase-like enzyme